LKLEDVMEWKKSGKNKSNENLKKSFPVKIMIDQKLLQNINI